MKSSLNNLKKLIVENGLSENIAEEIINNWSKDNIKVLKAKASHYFSEEDPELQTKFVENRLAYSLYDHLKERPVTWTKQKFMQIAEMQLFILED